MRPSSGNFGFMNILNKECSCFRHYELTLGTICKYHLDPGLLLRNTTLESWPCVELITEFDDVPRYVGGINFEDCV